MFYPSHFAPTRNNSLIAVGEFEQYVHIYDLESGTKLNSFHTVLEFGGNRLALNNDGSTCITGNYEESGIVCYSVEDGSVIWHRKDLIRNQEILVSGNGHKLYCDLDSQTCTVVDIKTGETIQNINPASMVYDSHFDSCLFYDSKNNYILNNTAINREMLIPKESFALLCCTFGPNRLLISESGKAVRCFDVNNGVEIWRITPEEGYHFLKLTYSTKDNCFYGVERKYDSGGGMRLYRLEAASYGVTVILDFPDQAEIVFVPFLNRLLCSNGSLINLRNGKTEVEIIFKKDK